MGAPAPAGDALRSYSAEFARRRRRPRGGGSAAWPEPPAAAPAAAATPPAQPWQQHELLGLLRQRRRCDVARAAPERPYEAGPPEPGRLSPAFAASRRVMPRLLQRARVPGSAPQLARGCALAREVGSVRSLSPPPPPPPLPLPDGLDYARREPAEGALGSGSQRRLQKQQQQVPQQQQRRQQAPPRPPQPPQPPQKLNVVEPPPRWWAESQLTEASYASASALSSAFRSASASHGTGLVASDAKSAPRPAAPQPGAYAARIASAAAAARSAKDARGSQTLAPRITQLEADLAAQRQAAQRLQSVNVRLQERLMQFHEQNSANVALARQRIGELEEALQRAAAAAEAAQRLRERDLARRRPISSTPKSKQPPPRQEPSAPPPQHQQEQEQRSKAPKAAKTLARSSEDKEQQPPQPQPHSNQELQQQQRRRQALDSISQMSFGAAPDASAREELVERELRDMRVRFAARSAARRARESKQRALRVWACAVLLSKLYAGARVRRVAQCQARCLAAWHRAAAVVSATRAVVERRRARERREAVHTIAREALHRWRVAARRDKEARVSAARERLASAFAGWCLAVHRRLRAENDRYRLELLLFPTPRGWNNAALAK
jgi:hypothetical protein